MASSSTSCTNITEFSGHHSWTIRNWKSWVGCSEKNATLLSSKFCIPIIDNQGMDRKTFWRLKAFPKKITSTGKDMLAFRLVSLNDVTPKGSFKFKTVADNVFGGESTISKFKTLPLDAAYHWVTCIRYHPCEDLTIKIKLKIVSAWVPDPAIPTPASNKKSGLMSRLWKKCLSPKFPTSSPFVSHPYISYPRL